MRKAFAIMILVLAPAFTGALVMVLANPAWAQMPGTLMPAPPVIVPPPNPPPAPVPSALPPPASTLAPPPPPGAFPRSGTYREPSVYYRVPKQRKGRKARRQSFTDRVVPCTQQAQVYNVPDSQRGAYISRCAGGDN